MVKGITEQTGTKIDIDDDGTVTISSTDGEQAEKAKRLIYKSRSVSHTACPQTRACTYS